MPKRKSKWQQDNERRGFVHSRQRGIAGARKGRHNEDRVEAVLAGIEFPWLLDARRATKAEDCAGIDFVCRTDEGDVYLQVKSSKAAADVFRRREIMKRLPMAVIVVSDAATPEKLRAQVVHRLTMLREELQCGSLEEWLRRRGVISSIDCALKEAINKYGPIDKSITRTVAGLVSVRLQAWVTGVLGLPPTRALDDGAGKVGGL